jgi:hypothetical protein
MNDDVNEYLFQSGARAFQFENVGDICHGTVVSAQVRQQTSLEGEALVWADGTPRKQLVIVVQTDEVTDDDDGQRSLFAKGGNYEIMTGDGTSMRDAIADAMKLQKASKLETGDELWVGYTGIGKARKGYSPPKLYSAKFRKGHSSVNASDIFGPEPSPLDTGV